MAIGPGNPEGAIFVGQGESLIRTFVHPLSNREFQWSNEDSQEARLRLMCDPEALKPYSRSLFQEIFPQDLEIGTYDPTSAQHHPETHPKEAGIAGMKAIRTAIMKDIFGYESTAKKTDLGAFDVPELRIGFSESGKGDYQKMTYWLNRLDVIRPLYSISQTDPRGFVFDERTQGRPRFRVSRFEHESHMGYKMTQTVLRIAFQQPELFCSAVERDLENYGFDITEGASFGPLGRTMTMEETHALNKLGFAQWDEAHQKSAIYAIGLLKHLLPVAYLHDAKTPGFGDIFMTTTARHEEQLSANYSEDVQLKSSIDTMAASPHTGLPQLINQFNLNKSLLVAMVKSTAGEGDSGLVGDLFKAKHKFDAKTRALFPELFKKEAWDLDQEGGTLINTQALAEELFPGGHKFMTPETPEPIGSFEERTRLLAYMLATGMTKRQVEEASAQLGLDKSRIFIGAEEYSIWHNVVLQEHTFFDVNKRPQTKILPVALLPGDVKKAILLFNVLHLWHYRSPQRATAEALMKTMIACNLYDYEHGNIQAVSWDTFVDRTDPEAFEQLLKKAPAIPFVLTTLQNYSTVWTESELADNVAAGAIANHLVIDGLPPGVIVTKPGTFVRSVEKNVVPYYDLIREKLDVETNTRVANPLSLPNRLDAASEALKQRLFKVVRLDDEVLHQLETRIKSAPGSRPAILRALRIWTKDIPLDGTMLHNQLDEVFAAMERKK